MFTKEEYLLYLTPQMIKDIERVCGKDWTAYDIPAIWRKELDEEIEWAEAAEKDKWDFYYSTRGVKGVN